MFFKRKPKPVAPGGFTDLHLHLLPAVDDGPADLEQALALHAGLRTLGYERFVATPHRYPRRFPLSTPERAAAALDELTAALGAGDAGELGIGAEYMFEPELIALAAEGRLRGLNGSRYVLVEFPKSLSAQPLPEMLFRLRTAGVVPVLAHPERWTYLMEDRDILERVVDGQSALLQLDLPSLAGKNGGNVKRHAVALLKEGMVDIVASDAHSPKDLELVYKGLMVARSLLSESDFIRLACETPRAIFDDAALI
ncbi:MAG: hypothetical protein KC609_25465 [Myxococcales bacterium]|nr:hypothetical protein [Myxococcales bacterium]